MAPIDEAQAFSHETEEAETETIVRKLRWMTYARLAVFVFLGGATAVFGVENIHPGEGRFVVGYFQPVDATDLVLFFTSGIGCVLTLLYAFALRLVRTLKNLKRLAHFQIMADALFAGIMVLLTGGTTSSFSFFFSIVIIEGAIIMYRTGAFYTATFCTLLFVGIGVAEISSAEGKNVLTEAVTTSDVKPSTRTDVAAAWSGLTYRILNSIVAFYSIAFMSSYLSERLRWSAQQLELNRLSLEDLRAIHENIVASIPTGVITLDPKGRVSFINPQAQIITGLVPGTALNQPVGELLPKLKRLIDGGKGAETTMITVQSGGGMVRDQLWSIAPLKNRKGRVIGHLLAVEDITKTREMEKQVQRSQRYATLGRLAATIAHEIRNPLTSIAGSIQLFGRREDRSEEDKRLMDIVVRETEALNRWITDFLTYARPLSQERGSLNIGREVSEALEVLRNDKRALNVDIQSSIPETALALSDPIAVKQIVWNVLINAVEAMPEGGKLWVEVDALTVEGFVQLRITDTGQGIDAENAEKIFDPFFTTKTGGTGLGLATVFRLATELGGKIDFNTLFGEGTTFYVDFPKPDEGVESTREAVAGLQLSEEDRQVVKTERASRRTDEHAALPRDQDGGSSASS